MTQIDTSRRGFLKSAVAASAAMMSAAAVHAGIPAKSVAKYDETFDVVIIGSGFAGMACALKAGRAGLKVLMIEKMSTVGGNSAICGGNVACPVNPVQKAQGIKDSKELFIADCLKDGLGINHTNLLSTIADRCNDTIQMVVDCGCEFVPNKMLFEGGHSVPRSYEIKAGTGSGYIRPMHEELKKLKNVVIRTRCKFDDFVMEEDGSVARATASTTRPSPTTSKTRPARSPSSAPRRASCSPPAASPATSSSVRSRTRASSRRPTPRTSPAPRPAC